MSFLHPVGPSLALGLDLTPYAGLHQAGWTGLPALVDLADGAQEAGAAVIHLSLEAVSDDILSALRARRPGRLRLQVRTDALDRACLMQAQEIMLQFDQAQVTDAGLAHALLRIRETGARAGVVLGMDADAMRRAADAGAQGVLLRSDAHQGASRLAPDIEAATLAQVMQCAVELGLDVVWHADANRQPLAAVMDCPGLVEICVGQGLLGAALQHGWVRSVAGYAARLARGPWHE